jgi:hypothetical protein
MTEGKVAMNVSVSPNPSAGKFELHIFSQRQNETAEAALIDLVGSMVMRKSILLTDAETTSAFEIPSAIANGTYFLRVKSGDDVHVMKLMIDR